MEIKTKTEKYYYAYLSHKNDGTYNCAVEGLTVAIDYNVGLILKPKLGANCHFKPLYFDNKEFVQRLCDKFNEDRLSGDEFVVRQLDISVYDEGY